MSLTKFTAWEAVVLPLNYARKRLWHENLLHNPPGLFAAIWSSTLAFVHRPGARRWATSVCDRQPGPSRTPGDAGSASGRRAPASNMRFSATGSAKFEGAFY